MEEVLIMTHPTSSTPAIAQVLRIVHGVLNSVVHDKDVDIATNSILLTAIMVGLQREATELEAPEREAAQGECIGCSPDFIEATGHHGLKCPQYVEPTPPPTPTETPPPAWDAERFPGDFGNKFYAEHSRWPFSAEMAQAARQNGIEETTRQWLVKADEWRDELRKANEKFAEEARIVDRIWKQLGVSEYTGKSIYEYIDELKTQAAYAEGQRGRGLPEECPAWFRDYHRVYGRAGIEWDLRAAWAALRSHFSTPTKGDGG